MSDFEAELANISNKLDKLELEITMSQEAVESIEMRLRLFSIELDFEAKGS